MTNEEWRMAQHQRQLCSTIKTVAVLVGVLGFGLIGTGGWWGAWTGVLGVFGAIALWTEAS